MAGEPISVLLVGVDEVLHEELAHDEGFLVDAAARLDERRSPLDVDAVVLALADGAPLEALGAVRAIAPSAALVVITDPAHTADGTVALHAGADDHLVSGAIPRGLLPRAVRYAVGLRRMRRELATIDDETGLPNLRGFAPIAEHHLRMADRAQTPVVFLFVRLDGLAGAEPDTAPALARDAASVVLEAIRGADVPARIAPDTFCVLLTGEAHGAETLVLSRLVEAIAVHDARADEPRPLSLSVGSALYDPAHASTLEQILTAADRHLTTQVRPDRSEDP
jgi:diguanylate cyclase (GGDEF)-like protein